MMMAVRFIIYIMMRILNFIFKFFSICYIDAIIGFVFVVLFTKCLLQNYYTNSRIFYSKQIFKWTYTFAKYSVSVNHVNDVIF